MTSGLFAFLVTVALSQQRVLGDSLGQLCLEADAVGTSETLRKICQEYYQYNDDGPSNEYITSKLQHLRSPPYDSSIDTSTFDGDKSNEEILRRTLLALLPSRSAYLRQVITGSSSSNIDDNKSDKRDGNYIRFGKKQYSQFKQTGPMARRYLASFGARDKKPDGQYMRFGRSVAVRNANDSGSRKENDILASSVAKNVSQDAAKSPEQKRFMRFGRGPAGSEKEKRFMRFGRAHRNDDETTVEDYNQSPANDLPFDALFFRLGRNFMRFGRSQTSQGTDSNSIIAKRYMRFGKRQDPLSANEARQQKRFMRFGRDLKRKRFMRFGKAQPEVALREQNVVADEAEYTGQKPMESRIEPEKRFMRFGKRTDAGATVDDSFDAEHKRFMRFGKRTLAVGGSSPKRFMRFGRNVDTVKTKKPLRTWKKSSQRMAN